MNKAEFNSTVVEIKNDRAEYLPRFFDWHDMVVRFFLI